MCKVILLLLVVQATDNWREAGVKRYHVCQPDMATCLKTLAATRYKLPEIKQTKYPKPLAIAVTCGTKVERHQDENGKG